MMFGGRARGIRSSSRSLCNVLLRAAVENQSLGHAGLQQVSLVFQGFIL